MYDYLELDDELYRNKCRWLWNWLPSGMNEIGIIAWLASLPVALAIFRWWLAVIMWLSLTAILEVMY
jgi:hypothetical protein